MAAHGWSTGTERTYRSVIKELVENLKYSAPGFIYTRHALHHLPDLWKVVALGRMAALLVPGGVLFLRDLVFAFEP